MTPEHEIDTAPAPAATARPGRHFSIGLPANRDIVERRFPFTPDSVARLTENGYSVKIEKGAALPLGYPDTRYSRSGAALVDHDTALKCDIVVSIEFPTARDIAQMKRGAILLVPANGLFTLQTDTANELLRHNILTIAIDLIATPNGRHPIADTLGEIDGRASILLATSLMMHPQGKGLLPGGVAGVIPTEVVILGSGIPARAAAASAAGIGAQTLIFDNDTYSLREALAELHQTTGSAPVPHVLENALRRADIVIATPSTRPIVIHSDLASVMKQGVVAIDINPGNNPAFPSFPAIEAALATDTFQGTCGTPACYINPGNLVPRTIAMALGDSLITLLSDLVDPEALQAGIHLSDNITPAVLTFNGHAVNPRFAQITGRRYTDINILLQLS